MKINALVLMCLTCGVGSLLSNEKSDLEEQIELTNQKYAEKYEALAAGAKKLEEDAPKGIENATGVDFDFSKWNDVSIDIPEFRMRRDDVIFDLPSVTMKVRRLVWDNPETRMVPKVVGKYPVFRGPSVKWKDIITHVPEVKMVRREAKLDIPEVTMVRHRIVIGIPEVFQTKRVSFKVPNFRIRTTEQAEAEMTNGANQIEMATKDLAKAQKNEIASLTVANLIEQREKLQKESESAVKSLTQSIEDIKKVGLDPASVVSEDGSKMNLIKTLEETSLSFSEGIAMINSEIEKLQSDSI